MHELLTLIYAMQRKVNPCAFSVIINNVAIFYIAKY